MDAAVAPCRVLGSETENQPAEFEGGRRSSSWSVGLGPVARHSSSMPTEEGVRRDDPAGSSLSGERGGDGAKQGPVVVAEYGSVDLAAQDADLVA